MARQMPVGPYVETALWVPVGPQEEMARQVPAGHPGTARWVLALPGHQEASWAELGHMVMGRTEPGHPEMGRTEPEHIQVGRTEPVNLETGRMEPGYLNWVQKQDITAASSGPGIAMARKGLVDITRTKLGSADLLEISPRSILLS